MLAATFRFYAQHDANLQFQPCLFARSANKGYFACHQRGNTLLSKMPKMGIKSRQGCFLRASFGAGGFALCRDALNYHREL